MQRVRLRRALGVLAAAVLVGAQATIAALAGAGPGGQLPPPTPVGPNASPSPFVTTLHTPADTSAEPAIAAASAILADLDTGQVLLAKNPDAQRPIASVTKIMTALLVLRRTTPGQTVTVSATAAAPEGSNGLSELGLEEGERITVGELTWALLVQSANDAAIALAEHVAGTQARFVKAMNAVAGRLGLRHTEFRSPNGLDDRGHSSARDLVTLTRAAFNEDPRFGAIIGTREHDVPSPEGEARHIQNRNVLLWLYRGATGVKTGYTSSAGFCMVATAQREGRRLIAVVLGEPGEPFSDAAALLNYGFDAFEEHTFVDPGESFGEVDIRGGSVPVATSQGLVALVPTAAIGNARRLVSVDPEAAFPPAPGEQVATLRVSIPGHPLGSVPLLVIDVPAPPPVDDRPWWSRAASSVGGAVSGALGAFVG
ncbi:MAG TPA: D-alanyl-D-alanine carboxypeptidase family protein [Actinomycetota bacterium]|nr:D-alanyl-D-alanine carboxypeptidase family protein [Actinomycetota bacterium]